MLIAKPAWADAISRVVNVITRPIRWIVGPLVNQFVNRSRGLPETPKTTRELVMNS
jgi:hypothetical protein